MKQSRAMSLVEAVANVVVGYVLAIATQIVVFLSTAPTKSASWAP